MTAPSCTCGRCHHCGRLLAEDEHSAVCGNGQCPREDTDIDANENSERGSPYFGDCKYGKVKQ